MAPVRAVRLWGLQTASTSELVPSCLGGMVAAIPIKVWTILTVDRAFVVAGTLEYLRIPIWK